jgi:hypothetical protein
MIIVDMSCIFLPLYWDAFEACFTDKSMVVSRRCMKIVFLQFLAWSEAVYG